MPECFEPVRIVKKRGRKGVEKHTFLDLSEYDFSGTEKDFICGQFNLRGDALLLVPTHFHYITGEAGLCQAKWCERHNLSRNTVKRWISKFKKNIVQYGTQDRRPDEVDQIGLDSVVKQVEEAELNPDIVCGVWEVQQMLGQARFETLQRKKKTKGNFAIIPVKVEGDYTSQLVPAKDVRLDHRTVERYKAKGDIRTRAAQPMSEARFAASHDIRCSLKFACMHMALSRHHKPCQKGNADAVSFEVKGEGAGNMVCVVRSKGDMRKVQTVHANDDLSIFIKVYALIFGSGEMARLLAIVALKDFPEDEFFVSDDIPGFSHDNSGTCGTVIICRTRGGNKKLWLWVWVNFVIPEIAKIQAKYKLKVLVLMFVLFLFYYLFHVLNIHG